MTNYYNKYKDGYAFESTYGSSAIPTANDSITGFGLIPEALKFPTPKALVEFMPEKVGSYEYSEIFKKTYVIPPGHLYEGMLNGIMFYLVMGKSSSTGPDGNGDYVHTITADALPSMTIHHEATGTASDWVVQYLGATLIGAMFRIGNSNNAQFLVGEGNWVCSKVERMGWKTNVTPSLPATENKNVYHWANTTIKYDTTTIEGIKSLEMAVSNKLTPIRGHQWESGSYDMWVQEYFSNSGKNYSIKLSMHPTAYTFFDELLSSSNDGTLEITFTRSATDYIKITFTGCEVTRHTQTTPKIGNPLVENVIMVAKSCSIEVKDKIPGSAYGE